MEQEKITVILPVYKVEEYIRACLESLLRQTYQNLEIILVDDGSPDGSGAICDEYAAKDSRVKVIHKENGGVSSARNAGLDAATGDYIGFVDPDDWVEEDMYGFLLEELHRNDADIVACGLVRDRGESHVVASCGEKQSFAGHEVDQTIVEHTMNPSSCNKLSRRGLWDGLRFPGIRIGEDQLTTSLLALRAEKIVCVPDVKYHYMLRDNSAIMSQSLTKWLANYRASRDWYDRMISVMPEREDLLAASCVYCGKYLWCIYGFAPREERKAAYKEMMDVSRFCAKWVPEELERRDLGILGRIALKSMRYPHRWALWVGTLASKVYRKTHGSPLTLE